MDAFLRGFALWVPADCTTAAGPARLQVDMGLHGLEKSAGPQRRLLTELDTGQPVPGMAVAHLFAWQASEQEDGRIARCAPQACTCRNGPVAP
jgi:hypothetical protein